MEVHTQFVQPSVLPILEASLPIAENTLLSETQSLIVTSPVLVVSAPIPNRSFETALSLAKITIPLLGLDKSAENFTLREAIFNYVIQHFNKEKDPYDLANYTQLICKLLNDEHPYPENMNFLPLGPKIRLLLNHPPLLDVPVKAIARINTESDLVKERIVDNQLTLQTLVRLMECYQKFLERFFLELETECQEIKESIYNQKQEVVQKLKKPKRHNEHLITGNTNNIKLPNEEVLRLFCKRVDALQITVNRYRSLQTYLLAQSKKFNTKINQQYQHLNSIRQELITFTDIITMQCENVKISLTAVIEKTRTVSPVNLISFLSTVIEKKAVKPVADSLQKLDLDDELLDKKVDGIVGGALDEIMNGIFGDSPPKKSSSTKVKIPKEHTEAFAKIAHSEYERLQVKINCFETVFYYFMEDLINFIGRQETLMTGEVSVDELKATSDWCAAMLIAERPVRSRSLPKIAQNKPVETDKILSISGKKEKINGASSSSSSDDEVKTSPVPKKPKKKGKKTQPKTHHKRKARKTTSTTQQKTDSEGLIFSLETEFKSGPSSQSAVNENTSILSLDRDNLVKASEGYIKDWKTVIKEMNGTPRFSSMLPEYRFEVSLAILESVKHFRYGIIGFEQFSNALQRQDWSTIKEIVPMITLDLGIHLEQLMRIAVFETDPEHPYQHDLVLNAEFTNIYSKLTPETQQLLHDISSSAVWGRYSENMLRYYRTRKLPLPQGLDILQKCHHLGEWKNHERSQFIDLVNEVFDLYRRQIQASFEIVNILTNQSHEGLCQSVAQLTQMVNRCRTHTLSTLPINHDYLVSKHDRNAHFTNEIKQLEALIETIELMMKRINAKHPISLKYNLKEGCIHLQRLVETLKIYTKNDHPRYQAWLYRNYMKIQLVLEELYTSRHYLISNKLEMDHNLTNHHVNLKDGEELNPASVSFGQSIHYSSSSTCHSEAISTVKSLNGFERNMKELSMDIDPEQVKSFEPQFAALVAQSIPLLTKHVEACAQDFEKTL